MHVTREMYDWLLVWLLGMRPGISEDLQGQVHNVRDRYAQHGLSYTAAGLMAQHSVRFPMDCCIYNWQWHLVCNKASE